MINCDINLRHIQWNRRRHSSVDTDTSRLNHVHAAYGHEEYFIVAGRGRVKCPLNQASHTHYL